MQRWVVLLALVTMSVEAAEITRVASSFDDNKPFGMFLDVGFERTQDRALITREWYQSGGLADVSELRYTLIDTRLLLDAHIGLYKDLEFHFGLPIVFQQDRRWNFAARTDPSNTTLYRNCSTAGGTGCEAPAVQGNGTGHLFDIGSATDPTGTSSYRGGVGDLTFGLAYAFFSQARDDTKPTWVVSFDYTAPTSSLNDPHIDTTSDSRGGIGDRIHRLKFATSISKRIGLLDPYFQLHYTLPLVGAGSYSNCDNPKNLGRPENCNVGPWTRDESGVKPAHVGGFVFGSEFNALERPAMHQKIGVDLRGWVTYTSEGRYNNELSDLMHKLLYSSDYMQVGGQFGIVGHAAEFIHLRAYVSWAYNTEHFLTNENVGKDVNGNGTVDITTTPQEINPNFDWRVDRVGRRFRISEEMLFKIMVTASFNF